MRRDGFKSCPVTESMESIPSAAKIKYSLRHGKLDWLKGTQDSYASITNIFCEGKYQSFVLFNANGTEVTFFLLTQRPRVRFSVFLKIYFNVNDIYQWHLLEESRQRLENVDGTNLVLTSGKLVQKH